MATILLTKAIMTTMARTILMVGMDATSMTWTTRAPDTYGATTPKGGMTRPTLATMPVAPTQSAGADGNIQTIGTIRIPTATAVGTPRLREGETKGS